MADPQRTDSARASDALSDLERDAKVEELLLVGLDHYFAAEYDAAVNIWTRALFLDRNHAKARAYIERARSAMAERQRESEELLHRGVDAFDRGQADEARRLLNDAMSRGVPSDEALAVLERIDRLSPVALDERPIARAPRPAAAPVRAISDKPSASPLPWFVAAAIVAAAAFVVGQSVDWRGMLGIETTTGITTTPAGAPQDPVSPTPPMPRRGEAALSRARAYAATGHLHDALAVLDEVKATDPQKAEADQLRARLQRELIALVPLDAGSVDQPAASGPSR